MFDLLRRLLKSNPYTHGAVKRLRRVFCPPFELLELVDQWGQAIEDLDFPRAYTLYGRYREIQDRLARQSGRNTSVRFLREQWTKHIGHISLLDIYVKQQLLGWRPSAENVILVCNGKVANQFYLELWKPYFTIISDPLSVRKLWSESVIREEQIYVTEMMGQYHFLSTVWSAVQKEWSAQKRLPLVRLDDVTRVKGRQMLQTLGMPQDAWFVSLHVRESGFRRRDGYCTRDAVRDANIDTYIKGIQAITARGGWVIRCGDRSMKPLPSLPQTIDYAHSDAKSDWMDVFLCAEPRFFVGTESGFSHVPATFGVPTLYTNWSPWGKPPASVSDFFIPKLYWSIASERYLSAEEILGSDLRMCHSTEHFASRGVALVDNSAEEVEQSIIELMEWLEQESHGPLSRRVQECYAAHGLVLNSHVMDGFLNRHERLFAFG